MAIYEQPTATNEEIKNCSGDYYGCEICRFACRCIEIKLGELNSLIKNNERSVKDE